MYEVRITRFAHLVAARLCVICCLLSSAVLRAQTEANQDTQLSKSRLVYDGRKLADNTWANTHFISRDRMLIFTLIDNKLHSITSQNLKTGASTRQRWLEAAIRNNGCNLGEIHFSPDGRWLMWANWHTYRREVVLVDTEHWRIKLLEVPTRDGRVIKPDTETFINLAAEDNIDEWNCAWSTDSKKMYLFTAIRDPGGLMSVINTHFTRVYTFKTQDGDGFKFAFEIAPGSPIAKGEGFPPLPGAASPLDSAIVTTMETLLTGVGSWPGNSNAEIDELNLNCGAMPVHAYLPRFPASLIEQHLAFSPCGTRIVWVVEKRDWTEFETAIYTTTTDCTNLKEVGHIRGDGINNAILNVRWLPNGKEVAFDCDKSTWIVPIDQRNTGTTPSPHELTAYQ